MHLPDESEISFTMQPSGAPRWKKMSTRTWSTASSRATLWLSFQMHALPGWGGGVRTTGLSLLLSAWNHTPAPLTRPSAAQNRGVSPGLGSRGAAHSTRRIRLSKPNPSNLLIARCASSLMVKVMNANPRLSRVSLS